MAISSINIQPSSGNAIIHNERIFDVAYALKNDDVNEYHRFASISETRKAIYEDYKLHHGRKLNTKATPIREAVVNLNENHKMEDLKKLSEMLENDYQMKVLHIAIHRDEGHIDKDGKENINYHAHIVFHNYDFDKHITIKRDKEVMRKLQTDVAKNLGMERGLENSQAVRLDHRQYKRAMQEVEVKTKELQRELKEVKQENTELKYNFKEMQKTITALELTSDEKKELHRLNSQVKNQAATIEQLNKKIEELTVKGKDNIERLIKKEREIIDLKTLTKDLATESTQNLTEYKKVKLELDSFKTQNKSLQEKNSILESKVITLEDKINSSANMSDYETIKKENESLKNENTSLKQKLKDIVSLVNNKIKSLFQYKVLNDYNLKKSRDWKTYINTERDDYWDEIVYYNSKEIDDNYKKNLDMELIKIDDFIPGEKQTPNYSKMNLEDILNLNKEDLKEFTKEATKELKELLEENKQETVVHTRKLF